MTVLAAALLALAIVLWPARGWVAGAAGEAGGDRRRGGGAGAEGEPVPRRARVRRVLRREVRPSGARHGWTADFAELSAVGLDAGLPSAQAAVLACAVGGSTHPEIAALGERLAAVDAEGGQVGDCLARCADDDPDLRFLAAAWQLTDEFGVAAAPAARTAAGVLRERAAAEQRRTVLVSGPRASMWLLTLLPLAGPAVSLLLGLPVEEVYSGGASFASASLGLMLTGAGWLWSRRLLGRAVQPARVR